MKVTHLTYNYSPFPYNKVVKTNLCEKGVPYLGGNLKGVTCKKCLAKIKKGESTSPSSIRNPR